MQLPSRYMTPPDRLRDDCSPAARLLVVHGIRVGESRCPACDALYPETTAGRCSCGRPLDVRCETRRCEGLVPPELSQGDWYSGDGRCAGCRARAAEEAKRKQLDVWFASAIKELELSRDYGCKGLDPRAAALLKRQREPLDRALQAWWRMNLGRDKGGRPWIVVIGATGTGKTVSLIRYSAAAYLRDMIASLAYVTEDELLWSISHAWSDRPEEKEPAEAMLRQARRAECLILDEVGKRTGPDFTRAQRGQYPAILKLRQDSGMPTLIAMNRALDAGAGPLAYLDSRVDSRLETVADVVVLRGADIRRAQREVVDHG